MRSTSGKIPSHRRGRLALVLKDTMDDGTLQAVGDACARAHARALLSGTVADVDTWPAVVVAALAPGTRVIPDEIVELVDGRYPGTQVLLVCDEPLVRPSLTLQRGRVTLVEPPATVERMTSRIRLLLANDPSDSNESNDDQETTLSPPAPGTMRSHEVRRPAWWAAELTCVGVDGERAARPILRVSQGLTALLAPHDGSIGEEELERATSMVRHEGDADEMESALAGALGSNAGLVHLSDDGQTWLIFWPCHHRPLWLFSPQRLPRWSDLSEASAASLWRLPAVAGDVIAALSSRSYFGSTGSLRTFLPPTEVSSAMLDGGPALLELFEARLTLAPRPFSCLLAEVR